MIGSNAAASSTNHGIAGGRIVSTFVGVMMARRWTITSDLGVAQAPGAEWKISAVPADTAKLSGQDRQCRKLVSGMTVRSRACAAGGGIAISFPPVWRAHAITSQVRRSLRVAASYRRPPIITMLTLSLLRMFVTGLASRITRSASLPCSSDPKSRSRPRVLAGMIVAA